MDVAGFDLNLLKAFDALYAERHVTHAGLRVGLSQSAMSGALTRLREVFEDELFVRTPAGMQPTPRAHDLAGPVADALRLVRGALQAGGFDPENRRPHVHDRDDRLCRVRSIALAASASQR